MILVSGPVIKYVELLNAQRISSFPSLLRILFTDTKLYYFMPRAGLLYTVVQCGHYIEAPGRQTLEFGPSAAHLGALARGSVQSKVGGLSCLAVAQQCCPLAKPRAHGAFVPTTQAPWTHSPAQKARPYLIGAQALDSKFSGPGSKFRILPLCSMVTKSQEGIGRGNKCPVPLSLLSKM